jgi:hypothetical protein
MDKSNILKEYEIIEQLYDKEDYDSVISYWENNKNKFNVNKKIYHDNLFLILSISYFEKGYLKKSLHYFNLRINNNLKNHSFSIQEMGEVYLLKISLLDKLNMKFKEYITTLEYLKMGGKLKTIIEHKDFIEENLYRKLMLFNKYLYGIFFLMITFNIFFMLKYGMFLGEILYIFYNTFSLLILIWMVINSLFHKQLKKWFMKFIYFIADKRISQFGRSCQNK